MSNRTEVSLCLFDATDYSFLQPAAISLQALPELNICYE